jgi:hypothetical protein
VQARACAAHLAVAVAATATASPAPVRRLKHKSGAATDVSWPNGCETPSDATVAASDDRPIDRPSIPARSLNIAQPQNGRSIRVLVAISARRRAAVAVELSDARENCMEENSNGRR